MMKEMTEMTGDQKLEKNYADYLQNMESALLKEAVQESAARLKPLGKFHQNGQGNWEPDFYPGYTLITPTFADDRVNSNAYAVLEELCRVLLLHNLRIPGLIPAPLPAFHLTVARLISGETFQQRIMNSREDELLTALDRLFRQIPPTGAWKYEIRGLTIFPAGIIAALVSPAAREDYQYLQDFRHTLYQNAVLTALGVERKRGFQGHITLAYLEKELGSGNRTVLAERISGINRRYFSTAMPFNITRVEVRKFDNYLNFFRRNDWPVLDLA